ncbi:signal peptidase II [Nocardioides thalensis]|uniref:Lipoprotein signal peptidase n=1 Tax=Nocardioides thalensis TaxID=1914755 RepID=A0A853C2K3_9ACTN|nr:signal peptidase II [Nocardioides thalensis]NYJ01865.1 signal peptidase II [Nocardioides thalensis]
MQAARGTSVGTPEGGADGHEAPARSRSWLLFAGVALVAYAVDQLTKHWAVSELAGEPDVQVVGELLQLHLTYNPGAAFSLGTDFTVALTCLAIVATFVVLWFSRRLGSAIWAIGLGLILAGIDGNLTDRLVRDPSPFRGHVIDFLMLPNWPVFNVADICINVGAGLVILQAFRGVQLDGSRAAKETDEKADGVTDEEDA